jgi:bacterial/archaeal transporter family-2 protein
MFKMAIPMTLAAASGICLVIQQGLNNNLRSALHSAVWSGFTSYVVGVLCMLLLAIALREPLPSMAAISRLPLWAFTGGIFGAIFIGLGIMLVPQIGTATFFVLLVAGQMLGALVFDHFGLMGVPVYPISMIRLAGAALLVGGVVLIRW